VSPPHAPPVATRATQTGAASEPMQSVPARQVGWKLVNAQLSPASRSATQSGLCDWSVQSQRTTLPATGAHSASPRHGAPSATDPLLGELLPPHAVRTRAHDAQRRRGECPDLDMRRSYHQRKPAVSASDVILKSAW